MIKRLEWFGNKIGEDFVFPASVPGNIQKDYAAAKDWGDINYGKNCEKYLDIEDDAWLYTAVYNYEKTDDRVHFMSGGIDYQYDILVNDAVVYSYEGSYAPVDIDITDVLAEGENRIAVKIYPHPKRPDAPFGRTQADASAKAPVGYGWDWHPRVIPSGIWNDAWLELKADDLPVVYAPTYTLKPDFSSAAVSFKVEGAESVKVTLTAPDGTVVYSGCDTEITVDAPLLWWCNGQGEPNLYSWKVEAGSVVKEGRIGFRTVELAMNIGAWFEPKGFPKSRSNPPITIRLNGRRIFAKGSNFVSPDIFPGVSCRASYEPLVRLAKEANMNIFRCWGGSGIQKDAFFELCDEMGILIWQEFPLACNEYKGDAHYLAVLESEARSIIRRLRVHPCVVIWCGGNELFNSWSRMTDQSLPLRLLNKLCYEEDQNTPFINTSPLSGMGHGGYTFIGEDKNGNQSEVFQLYKDAHCTAYTEFGVPSIATAESLRRIIPEDELFPPKPGGAYELHHGFDSWRKDTWLCLPTLEHYFGEIKSLEEMCDYSAVLQCVGYKSIFEEARRQQPYCSMVINWCYNEPWVTAAGNVLLSYPAVPKKAYYAVQNSLRPVLPSARLNKFSYEGEEEFQAELWLLNDTQEAVSDKISVYIEMGSETIHVMDWNTPLSEINGNIKGHTVNIKLPDPETAQLFTLRLVSEKYGTTEYTLYCKPKKKFFHPMVAMLNA